jgi:HNH endonuclease
VRVIERDGRPLSLGRKTRSVPPALRRALNTRDRGCRFPGCGSRRFVDAHHIEHWADGGATDISNLVVLCGHHHRLVHEGGYTITKQPGGRLAFHRPDGRAIPACPGAPPSRPAALARTLRPDACTPRCNDPLHLDLAVDAMLAIAPVATGEPPGI